MSNEKHFSKGDIIFKQGEQGTSFFRIISGKVEAVVNYGEADEKSLTELSEGQFFGELAAIEAYPRSATIVAKEDVTAEEIDQDGLKDLFTRDPSMILEIMKHIGVRIRELSSDYDSLNATIKSLKQDGTKKDGSMISKIRKFIDFYASGKNNIEKPSAESLREVSEKIKGQTLSCETYSKGTVIFKEGESGNCMYIVYDGTVGIYSNYGKDSQNRLTEIFPVACFGEMGMISGEARSATAVAEQPDTYVEIVRPDELEETFKTAPVKIEMILKHLSYRLRKLTYDYLNACKELNDLYNG